jgi:lysophospholipase L1-like esterase
MTARLIFNTPIDRRAIAGRSLPFGTGNILGLCTTQPADTSTFLGGTFRGPRFDVLLPGPIQRVQFLFTNFGTNDAGGPTPITVGCSVEVGTDPTGSGQSTNPKYPLTFEGKLSVTLDPLGSIWSDPLNIDLIQGQYLWPRTFLTVNAVSLGYPYTFPSSLSFGEGVDFSASNPVDNRNAGTITVAGNKTCYGPSAAVGVANGTRAPIVGVVGDSIVTGTGDSSPNVYPDYRLGWLTRGMAGRTPLIQTCRGGDVTAGVRSRRRTHLNLCDLVVCATGRNDLGTVTALQLEANWILLWRTLAAVGVAVWQSTITPRSSSTDNWTTLANQTTDSSNPVRTQANDWLRAGAPLDANFNPLAVGTSGALLAGNINHPLAGYLEVADWVESARNSGLWVTNFTADGIHPTAAGHIAASATVSGAGVFGYAGL